MDKKKRKDLTSSFSTGSWNTYKLEEYSGPDFITAGTIVRGMRVFQRQYKVQLDVVPGPQLLFWTAKLEERHETRAKRSKRKLQRKIQIRNYKFAVCSDDNLLFCNKILSINMVQLLTRALSCKGLKLLRLTGGNPVNLLMMYRQSAKQSPDHLKLQHKEYLASLADKVEHHGLMASEDLAQEIAEATRNKVFQTLGSQSDTIPHMQRINLSVTNVPNFETPSLQDFRWSHIEIETSAPSVFHLYREVGVLKLTDSVPEWLEKIRISGKTDAQARYL